MNRLEVIGATPHLESLRCDELLCEQYWHKGQLEEPANVIYLRCGDEWHRLCIDYGTIFWRTQKERPTPYLMPVWQGESRLDDLGVRIGIANHVIVSFEQAAIEGGAEVVLQFDNGQVLTLRNINDHTTIVV